MRKRLPIVRAILWLSVVGLIHGPSGSADEPRRPPAVEVTKPLGNLTGSATTPDDLATIAVSRSMLRKMRTQLVTLRDSMHLDLEPRERDYLALRAGGVNRDDPREQSLRLELEKCRNHFNLVVDQIKMLDLLCQQAESQKK